MIRYINKENFNDEVLNSNKVVLVDFFATWCGPCQMLGEVLKKVSESRADFNIAKVDVDVEMELASKYEVDLIPTVLIFKEGKLVDRFEGYVEEKDLIERVSKYM